MVNTPSLTLLPGPLKPRLVWFDLVLSHIKHFRLFNVKSIFIHKIRSISNKSVQRKYSFSLRTVNVKIVIFRSIELSISTQLVVFDL